MSKLFELTDRLLALLPFNGDKTTIAVGLKLSLPIAVAHFPVLLAAAPVVEAALDFLIATGLIHKFAKAAAPKKEEK